MGLFIGFFAVILLSSGPAFWCNGCGEHRSVTGAMGNGWIFHKLFYSLQCCICQGLGWPGLCTLQGHSVIFLLLSGKKEKFFTLWLSFRSSETNGQVYEKSGFGP